MSCKLICKQPNQMVWVIILKEKPLNRLDLRILDGAEGGT